MSRVRAVGSLALWSSTIVLALVVLHVTGTAFPAPPWDAPSALPAWVGTTPPELAAAAVVRLVALGLAAHLALVTTLGVVARLVGAVRTVHLLDRCSPPVLRRLLSSALGAGVLAPALLLVPVGAPAGASEPAVMRALPEQAAGTTTMHALPDQPTPTSTTTMHALPDQPTPTSTMHALPDQPTPTSTTTMHALPDQVPEPAHAATWTVRPGDHLWRVGEVVLVLARGGPVADADVDAYVHRIVQENLDVLVDPADPDLVLPGQVLRLPAT